MSPPISIDGTDITGATIDGTDVQEITVDGDVVFSAGPTLPVAYSNLIGWWPFDSATYGGSNADDVTAIIGGSGDDTAYDGTVSGATYQSSGGATDITAGSSSGYYEFDGNDIIDLGSSVFDPTSAFTVTHWAEVDDQFAWGDNDNDNGIRHNIGSGELFFEENDTIIKTSYSGGTGSFDFYAFTYDGSSDVEVYKNAGTSPIATDSGQTSGSSSLGFGIGGKNAGDARISGKFDDFRIYNTVLSGTQIDQIHTNTA